MINLAASKLKPMNYPLISEYIEAIKSAEDNFKDLTNLRPVIGDDGQPKMKSGDFSVIFKMKDERDGKLYALKCFIKEQEGRALRYRWIANELKSATSFYFVSIRYLEKELFVDTDHTTEADFPVLLMDWVEGKTLDKYLRENLDDKYALEMLAYRFSQLAQWLVLQPFAHGDLKPDNILVREDGTIVLVDYDEMYVPVMKGSEARELGSPNFRHPKRTEDDFNGHIDDFPLISILLSLKAISLKPSLLEKFGASNRLLFSEKDYQNLSESKVLDDLKPLLKDAELATLYSLFILALSQNNLTQVFFRLFNLSKPDKSQDEEDSLSTVSTPEDFEDGYLDEYGVLYSSDGMHLLSAPEELWDYTIMQGTKIIENKAFERWNDGGPHSVLIPESVIKIGDDSFAGCQNLEYVALPSHLVEIGEGAFSGSRIMAIKLNEGLKRIKDGAFWGSRLISITIPSTVKEIGNSAFKNCQKLVSITFSNSSVKLGEGIFDGCKELKSICVPYGTISIFKNLLSDYQEIIEEDDDEISSITDDSDFLKTEITNDDLTTAWIGECGVKYSADRKRLLRSSGFEIVNVRKGTIVICDRAFYEHGNGSFCSLLSINIPEGVLAIGNGAFWGCKIKSIYIPKTVKKISKHAYGCCDNLTSIIVDSQNEYYDSRDNCNAIIETETNTLISGCKTSFIPQGVNIINDSAFAFCKGLTSVIIPKSMIKIGKDAFHSCTGLTSLIVESENPVYDSRENCNAIIESNTNTLVVGCKNTFIPNTVTSIGDEAFDGHSELFEITFPNSVTSIGKKSFFCCFGLTSITLSESITSIGESAFACCSKLASIFIPIGSKKQFEELLPEYKDKLVEQEMERIVKSS